MTQIIQSLKEKIEHLKIISYSQNKGKGYAVRQGVKQTEALLCYIPIMIFRMR